MPSLQGFMSHGKKYWRVVECRRVNGKPRPVPICYLGSIENILSKFSSTEAPQDGWCVQSYEHGNIATLLAIAQELDVIAIINKHVPKNLWAQNPVGILSNRLPFNGLRHLF